MASSYQKFIAVGNLTRDAEERQVADKTVAKFAIAINGFRDGEVMFLDCEQWNPGGVVPYLVRGGSVLIEGTLSEDKWEKEGVTKTKLVCKVSRLQLLGSKKKQEEPVEEFSSF